MADPFLDVDGFTEEYQGTLTAGQTVTAERLLQVASDRIRELKADVATDPAKQAVFEIVRDAITYGHLEMLSSFQNVTSRRTEAGSFDEMVKAVDDLLTDRQKRMLGIVLRGGPVYSFPKCDY